MATNGNRLPTGSTTVRLGTSANNSNRVRARTSNIDSKISLLAFLKSEFNAVPGHSCSRRIFIDNSPFATQLVNS